MDFSVFEQRIAKIKNLPLPGAASQYKMAPNGRLAEFKKLDIKKVNPRNAGVMALFYPSTTQKTQLLLILRKTYKGVHSNQVAFPGGKKEKVDVSMLATALRETHEEVGVNPKDITVLRELTEIFIPPSNFMVQPFLGLYKNPRPFVKQESEVEETLEISLSNFLDESSVVTKTITTSYAKALQVPAYYLNGHIVWGATAMMLSEIKELIKQVL